MPALHQPPEMPKTFSTIFNITSAENDYVPMAIEGSTYNPDLALLAQQMKDDLEKRGLRLNLKKGPLNKDGSMSAVFRLGDMPDAVVRIGMIDKPAESAILLRPAAALFYPRADGTDGFQVHVMPFAPTTAEIMPTDIINTLRVLKAEGKHTKLSDIGPGQFVYLQDEQGVPLRYPDEVPDASMRGKPVAYIRDINAIRAAAGDDAAGAEGAQFANSAREVLDAVRLLMNNGFVNGMKVEIPVNGGDPYDHMGYLRALGLKPELAEDEKTIAIEGEEALKIYQMRGQLSVDALPPAPLEAVNAAAAGQAPLTEKLQAGLKAARINTLPGNDAKMTSTIAASPGNESPQKLHLSAGRQPQP